jgi:thioredoxin 1
LIVLVGIWFVKNNKNDIDYAESDNSGTVSSENSGTTASDKVVYDNPDFSLHVTDKIDLDKLKSYGIPIILDFGSDSCIPCKQMAPVLKELNAELQGKAIIRFVDVWKYRELSEGYPISVIPTQIFFDANGKPYKPKNPEASQMKIYTSRDNGEHIFTAHEGGATKEQLLDILKEMGLK